MRDILILLAFVMIGSCEKNEVTCNDVKYDQFFEARLGDQFCLNDFQFEIIDISDGKCPCQHQCIWEGMVSVKLVVTTAAKEQMQITINDRSDVIKNESIANFAPNLESFTILGDACIVNPGQDFILNLVVREE